MPTSIDGGLRAAVITVIEQQIARAPEPMPRLFGVVSGALEHHLAEGQPPLLGLELPLRVRAAVDGRPDEAIPVAAATTLMFLAFDLLDDLQDGDERAWWSGFSRAELHLAAAALTATLPYRILVRSTARPALAAAMVAALSSGLMEIAAGQALDLSGMGTREVTPAEAESAVEGKSGAQMALYARLASLHAGCLPAEVEAYARFARHLVCAGQIASDVADLVDPRWSRDLASGARTIPVAFALSRLEGEARADLIARLGPARRDRKAQQACIEGIRASGAFLYAGIRAGIHRNRARAALSGLSPRQPWRDALEALLDGPGPVRQEPGGAQ